MRVSENTRNWFYIAVVVLCYIVGSYEVHAADDWYGLHQDEVTQRGYEPWADSWGQPGYRQPRPEGSSNSRPNIFGGYDTQYHNGAACTSRPNIFGGYDTTCY